MRQPNCKHPCTRTHKSIVCASTPLRTSVGLQFSGFVTIGGTVKRQCYRRSVGSGQLGEASHREGQGIRDVRGCNTTLTCSSVIEACFCCLSTTTAAPPPPRAAAPPNTANSLREQTRACADSADAPNQARPSADPGTVSTAPVANLQAEPSRFPRRRLPPACRLARAFRSCRRAHPAHRTAGAGVAGSESCAPAVDGQDPTGWAGTGWAVVCACWGRPGSHRMGRRSPSCGLRRPAGCGGPGPAGRRARSRRARGAPNCSAGPIPE